MKVYRYKLDEETKKYIYRDEYECQEDPEEKGTYLKPQFSTEIKPELKEGFITYWEDDRWKHMEDYKNKEYYNLEDGSKVEYPDYNKLDTYTTEETKYKFSIFNKEENIWTPDIEKFKDYIKAEILNNIDNNVTKYAVIELENGESIEVNCSLDSLNAINSLIQYIEASGDSNKTVNFRLYDNTMMDLGIEDLKICSEKIMDIYQNNLQSKWKIKDEIILLSTFSEIEEYASNNDVNIYLKDENGNDIYPSDSIKIVKIKTKNKKK